MIVRRRIRAVGRVQGVWFRDSVRRAAEAAGVAGSAVNRDDGSVEVVLEGPEAAVEELVALCRRGPGHASVDRLDVDEEEPRGVRGFRTG